MWYEACVEHQVPRDIKKHGLRTPAELSGEGVVHVVHAENLGPSQRWGSKVDTCDERDLELPDPEFEHEPVFSVFVHVCCFLFFFFVESSNSLAKKFFPSDIGDRHERARYDCSKLSAIHEDWRSDGNG